MEGLNKLNRADDRRSYSKASIAYVEMLNNSASLNNQNTVNNSMSLTSINSGSNPNIAVSNASSTSTSLNVLDLCLATSAIVNAMNLSNNSNTSTVNFGASKNQMPAVPVLGIKQQTQPLRLASPKKIIYPLLSKYR